MLPVLFTVDNRYDFVSFVESQFDVSGSWFSPFEFEYIVGIKTEFEKSSKSKK